MAPTPDQQTQPDLPQQEYILRHLLRLHLQVETERAKTGGRAWVLPVILGLSLFIVVGGGVAGALGERSPLVNPFMCFMLVVSTAGVVLLRRRKRVRETKRIAEAQVALETNVNNTCAGFPDWTASLGGASAFLNARRAHDALTVVRRRLVGASVQAPRPPASAVPPPLPPASDAGVAVPSPPAAFPGRASFPMPPAGGVSSGALLTPFSPFAMAVLCLLTVSIYRHRWAGRVSKAMWAAGVWPSETQPAGGWHTVKLAGAISRILAEEGTRMRPFGPGGIATFVVIKLFAWLLLGLSAGALFPIMIPAWLLAECVISGTLQANLNRVLELRGGL